MSPRITLYGESASAYRGFLGILLIGVGVGLILWKFEDPNTSFWLVIIALGLFGLAYYHLRRSYIFCGWKYIIWGVVGWGIIAGFFWGLSQSEGSPPNARSQNSFQVQQTIGPNAYVAKTSTMKPIKTSTLKSIMTPTSSDTCQFWSEISVTDVGINTCVYGTAKNTYSRDGAFFVVFGSDPQDFYFINYGEGWYEGMRGNCVMAEGEIKQLGRAPVIVVGDTGFIKCED